MIVWFCIAQTWVISCSSSVSVRFLLRYTFLDILKSVHSYTLDKVYVCRLYRMFTNVYLIDFISLDFLVHNTCYPASTKSRCRDFENYA